MTDANVWLILDSGAVVGCVSYASRAAAERDADTLRAEASEALGYAISAGQIEVYRVPVVNLPIHGPAATGVSADPGAKGDVDGGAVQDIDPFAPPPGYRPPAPDGQPKRHVAFDYDDSTEVDPFALPGRQPQAKGGAEPLQDGLVGSGLVQTTGSARRRHLTLVR